MKNIKMPVIVEDPYPGPYPEPLDESEINDFAEPIDHKGQRIIEISVKVFVVFLFVLATTYAFAKCYVFCSGRDTSEISAIPIRRISRPFRNRSVPIRSGVNDLPPTYNEISESQFPKIKSMSKNEDLAPPSYDSLGSSLPQPSFENARVRIFAPLDLNGQI